MTVRFAVALCAVAIWVAAGTSLPAAEPTRPPNVVILFADDMGYADLGCFGAKQIRTPHLDRMASEGVRATNFYVAQAVCSASRTALLTGCYPHRVGIMGALGPKSRIGISDAEMTLGQLFKSKQYATAIYGKWHLGHLPQFLPTRHGFDEYFGLPYSNDMWPRHPTAKDFPPLPLIEGEAVKETNPDQTQLTTWYTERAVSFIERHRAEPFFLYVPYAMPHVPLFVSEKHRGKSGQGLYGDVIEELDWSVGQILGALQQHQLGDNTLVIFTSDNGPWLSYGHHGGSAGPLREGKGTSFDGGVRVPFVARYPGKIPAGQTIDTPFMTIDLFPTCAALCGANLPPEPIDGRNVWPLLTGETKAPPHEALFFYWGEHLQAVRSGPWKLHFPHPYIHLVEGGRDGLPGRLVNQPLELSLFNLDDDIGESKNVAGERPEIVSRLSQLADEAVKELGDSARKVRGAGIREPGRATP